ncbi:MAG: ImmA/IrrE family metallo-endopeptidase [Synergistetes bacterium]|nr:ImmA/IrrE family metallo-endopeptidase [Synergistota bacterium]MDW8192926.1 ImmA/IrrE family metallo-endopeptidase [Synergistota bacterium]
MSLPVNLDEIASSLGIVLIPYNLPPSICGLAYLGRKKFIIYNSNHSLTRQRFTIAHEIYHIENHLMGERPLKKDKRILEEEANRGAARILLPYKDLREHIEDGYWKYDLTSLARKAIVSPLTLIKRLNETKLLKVSLYKLSIKGNNLSIVKLYGDPSPLPSKAILFEGAKGKEFFFRKDGHFFHFSRYGKSPLLYAYVI